MRTGWGYSAMPMDRPENAGRPVWQARYHSCYYLLESCRAKKARRQVNREKSQALMTQSPQRGRRSITEEKEMTMKKTLSLLVAVAFFSVSGFAAAQAAAQSRVPSVQAAAGGAAKAEAKTKAKSKKAKAPRSKKAKAR